jgi:hypothetical protein
MSALPRPDLTGPTRVLNDALHDLHHHAGWPSLRTLAKETGVSHTTVSKAFSQTALPTWGTLELLVEAMDGDNHTFHQLWLAASAPASGNGDSPPTARIAGRRTELDVVRRHLETGTGLLLVTGEAGIGKSTLVRAAAAAAAPHVATGHCRPLSTPVPLMPVVEVLRELLSTDERTWSDAVLRACPAWVWPTLAPLLPELGAEALKGPQDFGRHRLMSALITLLEAFHAERALALWLEDLPWADSETLDLVEMLESRGSRLPVVATWRTEDPDTTAVHTQWWDRMAARTSRVALVPLSREETADQLELMDGVVPAAARVDQIYRRSQGQPLFTEHLASGNPVGDALPDVLAGALSRRLDVLDGDDWLVVRTLGIADRALTVDQLVRAAAVQADPVPALRTLVRQRLVASVDDKVQLRHPLLGEAVRAMLVPGEERDVHAGIAGALEELSDPPAAEIAGHWQAARRPQDELRWRIRAALAADARFGRREAFAEWSRVLDLWGIASPPEGGVEVDLATVLVRRIESAIRAGLGVEAVGGFIEDAMATPLPDLGRAEVLLRAGDIECGFGDVARGLRLIDEAVVIQSRHAPTKEAARVLEVRVNILSSLGRNEDLKADIARGLDIATALDAPEITRIFLAQSALAHLVDGDLGGARDLAWQAVRAVDPDRDPAGTIRVGASATEVLLAVGAPAAELAAAAADAVAHADRWQVMGLAVDGLYSDVAEAHLRAGDVTRAAEWIEPRVQGLTGTQLRRSRRALCAVDVRRGEVASTLARLEALEVVDRGDNYAVSAALRNPVHTEALLWSGRASEAIARLDLALDLVSTNDLALQSAGLLSLRARAEADLVRSAEAPERDAARSRVEQARAMCTVDPFGPRAYGADLAAHTTTWFCEVQRILGRDLVGPWTDAAAEWDALTRPHDAAYCRWRAAQAAFREGQGTVAARLLKRAATEAREHVPLSRAIAATVAGARG